MHVEQKNLAQKNNELAEAYSKKARSQSQLQRLYTSLKQQQVAAGMELAADHDAENVLHAAGLDTFNHATHRNGHPLQSRNSHGSEGSGRRRRTDYTWENNLPQGSRAGLQSARKFR